MAIAIPMMHKIDRDFLKRLNLDGCGGTGEFFMGRNAVDGREKAY